MVSLRRLWKETLGDPMISIDPVTMSGPFRKHTKDP